MLLHFSMEIWLCNHHTKYRNLSWIYWMIFLSIFKTKVVYDFCNGIVKVNRDTWNCSGLECKKTSEEHSERGAFKERDSGSIHRTRVETNRQHLHKHKEKENSGKTNKKKEKKKKRDQVKERNNKEAWPNNGSEGRTRSTIIGIS